MADPLTPPRLPRPGATVPSVISWARDLVRTATTALALMTRRLNDTAARGETAVLPLWERTVADLPAAADHEGALVFVTDDVGGSIPAFSDGTDWRRVNDRTVVTT